MLVRFSRSSSPLQAAAAVAALAFGAAAMAQATAANAPVPAYSLSGNATLGQCPDRC